MAKITITKKQREDVESLVIKFFDVLDKSHTNSDYYKKVFAELDDNQFIKMMEQKFPFRFHYRPSVVEPTMKQAEDALKVLGVPMMEEISLDFLYENKEGKAPKSQKCLVGYTYDKKVQQMITKKNKLATEIENRDMKSGLLKGHDKGAGTSEREFEALTTFGLDETIKEFAKPKADAMLAKNVMYSNIASTGMVKMEDLPNEVDDSLAKNLMNVFMIGSHLNTNLINTDNYTTRSLKKG
ncbi:MAG: hypothetical protein PHC62_00045 [Candidatus Izemoplasmatales bacterium]|nr:hypothetical protein [Candidatus Izemoplasmatales bacterium]